MRIIIALMLMLALLASSAFAQNEAMRDPDRGVWEKLQTITSGDTQEEKTEQLKSHGMSDAGANAVVLYMEEGNKKLAEIGKQKIAARCAKGEKLKADRDALADEVIASSDALFAARSKLVKGINSVLGPIDQSSLEMALSHMGEPDFTDFDVSTKIRTGKYDAARFIEDACFMAAKEG